MESKEKERIAVRAIIVIDNKVMLGKRGRGIGIGQYALIGGKPDGEESLEETAVRETKEETGLDFKNLVLWKEEKNDQTIPGQTWRTLYFVGEVKGKMKLKKDEVKGVIMVDRRNLQNFDIAFGHKEILEEFFGLR